MDKLFTLILTLLLLPALAQRGPGGVSDDSSNDRNCRLWVDAGDLSTLNDLDPVTLWVDKSVSSHVDELFWNSSLTSVPPTFRNALSAGINGRPAVSFDAGGMLAIGTWNGGDNSANNSPDLNSNADKLTTYEQTIFVVLRTGANVDGRQIIWEEGGSERGFTIHILNGQMRISAYDRNANDTDVNSPPRVPAFGFTYKTLPVTPNTTYTISLLFKVPTNNTVVTNSNATPSMFGLGGTLNGLSFPATMLKNCCGGDEARVGGVFRHPDPIGIGAQNRTTYIETAAVGDINTGDFPFLGRISEIIYYATSLSPAERIIVENYLAAKYGSAAIANERYVHKSGFAEDVIGIGQESSTDRHLRSQADNLFELSVNAGLASTLFPSGPGYVMTGHNNGPLLWSNQNVPDTVNVQRLRRTWRFDHNGNTAPSTNLLFRIDGNPQSGPQALPQLPTLPTGYTKYGLLIESTSPNFPNFSEANSTIVELIPVGGGFYEAQAAIPDNAFVTICAYRPSVQFQLESDFAVEGDPSSPPTPEWSGRSATIELNYVPTSSLSVNIDFLDGDAVFGTDYQWNTAASTITFAPGQKTAVIPFDVVYDVIENVPASRDFNIVLLGTGAPGDPVVGARDTLEYIIYDDDPDPEVTFTQTLYSFNESDGTVQIPVQVIGTLTGPVTVNMLRRITPPPAFPVAHPAVEDEDYTVPSPVQTLTFTPGNQIQFYTVNIEDDDIHEFDEGLVIQIWTFSSGVSLGPNRFAELRIIENDPQPTVSFFSSESEGYRSVQNPVVSIQLSGLSSKEIEVPFSIIGGSAIAEPNAGADYASAASGTVVIPPMDSTGVLFYNLNSEQIEISVLENLTLQSNRDIIFELDNNPTNALVGSPSQHTYTIKWYIPFDFTGAGGVGRLRNNTIWLIPDLIAGTGNVQQVPNASETDVLLRRPNISGSGSGNNPSVSPATLNGHKMLRFGGTTSSGDYLGIGSSTSGDEQGTHPLVNVAGRYESKSLYMVFIPRNVSMQGGTTRAAQVLFEQGGNVRGISLYIRDSRLHFAVWNNNDEGGLELPPWGLDAVNGLDNTAPEVIEYNQNLVNNQAYLISAHYDANADPGMRLYVNGDLVGSIPGSRVGRLWTHSGRNSIGAMWHASAIDGIPIGTGVNDVTHFFNGDIAEFIYFDEPNLTSSQRLHETRNRIIHNYLSAKFNLPLNTGQVADLNFADVNSSNPLFNEELAGLGRLMDGPDELIHGISQGTAPMRVSAPVFNTQEAILTWAHNREDVTNTWPFSYGNASLPADVVERSGRVWKFYAEPVNGIDSVDIEISFGASSNAAFFSADRQSLRLLTHTNTDPNDFSNANVYTMAASQPSTGTFVRFANVPVTNGMYVALGNANAAVPLPIELLSFDAKLNMGVVDLTWSTASEINNDFFVVERASDLLDWQPIETIRGAGNSTSRVNYATVDRNPLVGLSYYRLKQVDFDGTYSYSDVRAVRNMQEADEDHALLFPNPSSDGQVFVRIPTAYKEFPLNLVLYDLQGKLVWSKRSAVGESLIEVNYGDLPAGMYLLELRSELFSETKKLVVE